MTSTRYPRFAISSGAISLFFSVAALLTNAGLPFQFGSSKGHVSLVVGDTLVNAVAWFIALIGFLAYPVIIREARSSRLVLLTNGTVFILLLSTISWPQASLLLGIANIIGYLIALRESPRVLGIPRARMVTLSLTTLLGFAILVEALAFFAWLTDPFAAQKGYSGASSILLASGKLELGFFYVAYALLVYLISLLMVSPILEPIYRRARRSTSATPMLNMKSAQLNRAFLAGGLATALVLAGLITFLPYTFSNYPVGIDAHWYYEKLDALGANVSLSQFLGEQARAVYLLFLYTIRSITQLPARETVMTGSIIVSVIFAIGSFLLVRETGQGDRASLLAALFAGVSSQTLVATLASIFSNWLALVEMLFFFAFFLRAVRTGRKAWLAASFAISFLVMVTHPWTWPILMMILAIYVVISALQDRSWTSLRRSAGLRILAASLLVGLIVFAFASGLEVFRGIIDLGYSWAFLENLRLWRTPAMFRSDLQIALFNYSTQGLYSNWLLISLALVGVFSLARFQKETRALFGSWILGPSLLVFLLSPEIQWRLLFLIPYHILAVIGALAMSNTFGTLVRDRSQSRLNSLMVTAVQILFIAFLVLLFLNNATRSMAYISTQVSL